MLDTLYSVVIDKKVVVMNQSLKYNEIRYSMSYEYDRIAEKRRRYPKSQKNSEGSKNIQELQKNVHGQTDREFVSRLSVCFRNNFSEHPNHISGICRFN